MKGISSLDEKQIKRVAINFTDYCPLSIIKS